MNGDGRQGHNGMPGRGAARDTMDTVTVPRRRLYPRLLSYQPSNMQGIGMRERQEDSFAMANATDVSRIRTEGLLAVVADGMGGMADGKLASEKTTSILRQDFQSFHMDGNITGQMRESVFHADAEVYRALRGQGGSTVVMCVFFQEHLYFCSVGDSGIYLYRDGTLLRINQPHNRMNELYLSAIRSGKLDPREARTDPEKEALTQFVGMDGIREVDCFRRPLRLLEGDSILLCSDGVGNALPEGELARCLRETPPKACAELEERIRRKQDPYQDNYTALVIRCGY